MKTKKILLFALVLITINQIYSQKSVNSLIQGKWQHTEDKTNFLVFRNNHKYEIAGGMDKWDDVTYNITQGNDGQFYLSEPDCQFCWTVYVNATNLELTYLSRGNTLSYTKVRNKKRKK